MITQLMVRISNAGAGDAIMWFMVALSVLSALLIAERFVHYRHAGGDTELEYARISEMLAGERFEEALNTLKDQKTMIARVAVAGLRRIHHGRHAVKETMVAATMMERQKGERFLSILGTLGANAPFVGLLGTVVEIIHTLSASGGMSAEKIPQMMADLSTALAATAVGLVVALPAVTANNYFRRRLGTMETSAAAIRHELLSYTELPEAPKAS